MNGTIGRGTSWTILGSALPFFGSIGLGDLRGEEDTLHIWRDSYARRVTHTNASWVSQQRAEELRAWSPGQIKVKSTFF